MNQNDSLIAKLLKQKRADEEESGQGLYEFAMDIEFPLRDQEQSED